MRDKTYDQEIMNHFFRSSIAFFSKNVPQEESQFKYEFHQAHSDWVGMKFQIETYPIKPSLIKPIIELFDKAQLYFYCIVGSQQSYSAATFTHRNRWMELQALAKGIQKESGFP